MFIIIYLYYYYVTFNFQVLFNIPIFLMMNMKYDCIFSSSAHWHLSVCLPVCDVICRRHYPESQYKVADWRHSPGTCRARPWGSRRCWVLWPVGSSTSSTWGTRHAGTSGWSPSFRTEKEATGGQTLVVIKNYVCIHKTARFLRVKTLAAWYRVSFPP